MAPLISVVLTTYNRANVLNDTLDDILRQTLDDFELIICDDCSSDSTKEICENYQLQDKRIRYFRQKRNVKMPANLNFGIKQCRSDFIANLHDGDSYREDLLEKWFAILIKYSNAAFVFNEYQALDKNGNIIRHYCEPLPEVMTGKEFLKRITFRRILFDDPVWGTVMGRKSIYEKEGLFDERFGIMAVDDMWLKLPCKYDVGYVNEPLIKFASRDVMQSTNDFPYIYQMKVADEIFLKSRRTVYSDNSALLIKEITKHYIFRALKGLYNGAVFVKRGQMRMAFAFLKTCLGYYQ